jgi:hypothetical protein
MAADVIQLADHRPPPPVNGNGAREALLAMLRSVDPFYELRAVDLILTDLWIRGFQVVPIDPADTA